MNLHEFNSGLISISGDRSVNEVGNASPQAKEEDVFETTGSLGSFNKLPVEVLSEIFVWCCPTWEYHCRAPAVSPLLISHVCRDWRQVALDTPELWTYLSLVVSYAERRGMERATNQLKFWIDKAQNLPLFIDAEFIEIPGRWPACNVFPQVMCLMEVVLGLKRSTAFSKTKLHAALDAATTPLYSSDACPVVLEQYTWAEVGLRPDRPALGSVRMHINRYAEILFGLEGHATLGPHLIHLDLRDPGNLINLSVEEFLAALSNFPHLDFCALRIGQSEDEVAEPLVLTHLQTLILSWKDGIEIAALLDSIVAPSLRELELSGPLFPREYLPGNRWNHLEDFLRRSSPHIHILTLAKMDGTTLNLLTCLGLCSGLRRLSLEGCTLDAELMDTLRVADATIGRAVHTLARVEYLALLSCDIYELEEFLRDSLDLQVWLRLNLRQLYIIDCGYISEGVLAAIKDLPLDVFDTDPELLNDMLP